LHLFQLDRHYLIADGKLQIVDEYTGRVMADRSWERGLHQMIEVKEGLDLSKRRDTISRITYQRFFRRYLCLAGMTGTATEVAPEMRSVYALDVAPHPANRADRSAATSGSACIPRQRAALGGGRRARRPRCAPVGGRC
jgi:preprotein translocase subunit SecA